MEWKLAIKYCIYDDKFERYDSAEEEIWFEDHPNWSSAFQSLKREAKLTEEELKSDDRKYLFLTLSVENVTEK